MEFPLIIFLYIYFAFLAIWFIMFLIALYHMLHFSFRNLASVLIMLVFIAVAGLMFNASAEMIKQIDWTKKVPVFMPEERVEIPY